ncbi:hypothetical protein ABVK25_012428 [Lepraria finkii]|uniref:Uncharacterized protein n=1 Tax=Lepraria finkii TaxID=1340010 RepID=A0ABR4AF88_9LECA
MSSPSGAAVELALSVTWRSDDVGPKAGSATVGAERPVRARHRSLTVTHGPARRVALPGDRPGRRRTVLEAPTICTRAGQAPPHRLPRWASSSVLPLAARFHAAPVRRSEPRSSSARDRGDRRPDPAFAASKWSGFGPFPLAPEGSAEQYRPTPGRRRSPAPAGCAGPVHRRFPPMR